MLKPVDSALSERLAQMTERPEWSAVEAWLTGSRDGLRETVEVDDADQPALRGGARLLTLLLREIEAARQRRR
jgi:hypothetical protein